jgi:hypothetical protein
VALVAVSPQSPDGSLSMQETNDLAFTAVSDPGNTLIADAGHVLRWIDVHPDYSIRTAPDQILAALDTLHL